MRVSPVALLPSRTLPLRAAGGGVPCAPPDHGPHPRLARQCGCVRTEPRHSHPEQALHRLRAGACRAPPQTLQGQAGRPRIRGSRAGNPMRLGVRTRQRLYQEQPWPQSARWRSVAKALGQHGSGGGGPWASPVTPPGLSFLICRTRVIMLLPPPEPSAGGRSRFQSPRRVLAPDWLVHRTSGPVPGVPGGEVPPPAWAMCPSLTCTPDPRPPVNRSTRGH